ncbi:AP-1 complex subunit mu-2-like [Passer montanus]|uniref:AP-1 complex subunit mu-2-like n=1 Tax=Passer montanus TaxID=9160 RepID=UPI001960DED0|nr:AP-1 complex subunit mu-2-like [Passer montanus]
MAASALFILDLKGKPLISRSYKGDVGLGEIENFMGALLQREEEGTLTPVLTHGHVHFLWIKHANLYLVATTKKNGNASLVFSFLYKVVEVFCEYFKELEEESIRDNFVIVYELLDELMDFGFPQTTDSKILQEGLTPGTEPVVPARPCPQVSANGSVVLSEVVGTIKLKVFLSGMPELRLGLNEGCAGHKEGLGRGLTPGTEPVVPARPCPQVNANGSVVLSEVVGTIKLKVFLSGMPELRLGLNDRVLFELTGRGKNKSVELEDVKFHQCVRLSRFDNDRTISFIPPDGDFELMSYRLHTQVKPLIWIESIIEKFSHSRVEIMVKAKGQFKKQSVASGVEISVPVPSDADSPKFKTTAGSARYLPERNVVVWSIKSFPGGREHLLRAHFGLPSVEREEEEGRPPIAVRFEIPYFTVSGIQVPPRGGEGARRGVA